MSNPRISVSCPDSTNSRMRSNPARVPSKVSMTDPSSIFSKVTVKSLEIFLRIASIDTVQKPNGENLTEAVFVPQTGSAGLGQLKVKKTVSGDNATFTGKAFILT